MDLEYVPSVANFVLVPAWATATRFSRLCSELGIIVRAMRSYKLPRVDSASPSAPPEQNRRFIAELQKLDDAARRMARSAREQTSPL